MLWPCLIFLRLYKFECIRVSSQKKFQELVKYDAKNNILKKIHYQNTNSRPYLFNEFKVSRGKNKNLFIIYRSLRSIAVVYLVYISLRMLFTLSYVYCGIEKLYLIDWCMGSLQVLCVWRHCLMLTLLSWFRDSVILYWVGLLLRYYQP